jgi:hypothetical protein
VRYRKNNIAAFVFYFFLMKVVVGVGGGGRGNWLYRVLMFF